MTGTKKAVQDGLIKEGSSTIAKGGFTLVVFVIMVASVFGAWQIFGEDVGDAFDFKQTVEDNEKSVAEILAWKKEMEAWVIQEQRIDLEFSNKINNHEERIQDHTDKFASDDGIIQQNSADIVLLKNFETAATGRIERAEQKIETLIVKEAEQRERAQDRKGVRKVRDRRIDENLTRTEENLTLIKELHDEIARIDQKFIDATEVERVEYRKATKDALREIEKLERENLELRRELGDAHKVQDAQ